MDSVTVRDLRNKAASAIAHGLPLYSCSPSDFEAIPRLDLRSVPHPDR